MLKLIKIHANILIPFFLIILLAGSWFYLHYNHAISVSSTAVQTSPSPGHKNSIYYKDKVVVLLYHNFSQHECGTAISPARFESHLDMLKQEGFHIVSLNDVVAFLNKKEKLPPNAVAISLDDGYQSNYQVAYPMLKKKNWPATIFVIVKNVSETKHPNKWLSWDQIAEMSRHKISIYSHSYQGHQFISGSFPRGTAWLVGKLPGEKENVYQQRIFDDLLKARQVLQLQLGGQRDSFAIPFGMFNQTVIDMAKKSGYQYIWTTQRVPITASSSPSALGRVSVGRGGTSPEQLKDTILKVAAH